MRRLAIVFLMLMLTFSSAEDFVAINSLDGRDVLSGIYYANVKDLPVKFLPYPGGDADIFAASVGSGHDILLIQGSLPVTGLVESALRANNNTVELYESADALSTNLDLAARSGASSFVIVDSAYSDGAMSVLPYASLTDSYVIFADKNNIDDVEAAVAGSGVTLYSYLDQDVREALAPMAPEVIGEGEDKYADNVLLAGMLMDDYSFNRIIITDGSFIEYSMATGGVPIVLSGRIVPSVTYGFVKDRLRSGQLKEVLLIGNTPSSSLVTPVYDMRERMEVELFNEEGLNKTFLITVKFGQVIPEVSGPMNLDLFPLPSYKPSLNISDVVYNSESGTVMITVDNLGEGAAYYTLEARIQADGADYAVLTDADPTLIERENSAGVEFPLDLSSVPEGDITALVVAKYGAYPGSLEDYAHYSGELTTISFVDESNVTVQHARYDREKEGLMVTLRNNEDETVYVSSKAQLLIDGAPTNISGTAVRELAANSLIVEEFPLELSEEDISANKNTTIYLDYGARRGFLNKHGEYTVPLEEAGFPILYIGLIIMVILAAIYYYRSRRKK